MSYRYNIIENIKMKFNHYIIIIIFDYEKY